MHLKEYTKESSNVVSLSLSHLNVVVNETFFEFSIFIVHLTHLTCYAISLTSNACVMQYTNQIQYL